MEEDSPFHALVLRQLKRAQISKDDILPKWEDLLLRVSRAYTNYEQDLYLLERSMDISSRELSDLNQKLESAQQIARLGYWRYDHEEDLLYWSKSMYELTGFDPLLAALSLNELLNQIIEEDRSQIADQFKKAFIEDKEFSMEFRFKNKHTGKYNWHFVKGHPEKEVGNSNRYLTGIVIDISEQKQREAELEKTHQQLLSLSRQAGMAEVATSILHNIGNILNSTNVSIDILKENISQPFITKFFKIITMLKTHQDNLNAYLTHDEKGQLIPSYLIELGDLIEKEFKQNTIEIHNINTNLIYIKEIVAMQKVISGTSGIVEKIFVPDVVETALQMDKEALKRGNIKISKTFAKVPYIQSDKSKILQIMLNLVRNAKDALMNCTLDISKDLNIIIENKSNKIQILVMDNGIGITPEHNKFIFTFGFTTKKDGHGFGLHSSALLAKEIGGSLQATSAGHNKGATFTLTLPVSPKVI